MAVRNYVGAFGHVVLDHILTVPYLPRPDTSVGVLDQECYFGGTAGNLARAAGRLGVRVALAAFVGPDFPDDYRRALRADGVDLTDLKTVRGHDTPQAWVFSDGRSHQMTIINQGPWNLGERLPVLRHSVRDVEVVHLGTGRPAYYAKVATLAEDLGRPLDFDPAQEITYLYDRRSFRALFRKARYFFGNEHEVAQAMRYMGARSVRDLLRPVEAIVMTRGAKGSVVVTGEGKMAVPAVRPRDVVEITGAGDAYRAGFYAGMSRGYDLRRSALLGSAVASFVIERKGTQTNLPTWEQTIARARRHASF